MLDRRAHRSTSTQLLRRSDSATRPALLLELPLGSGPHVRIVAGSEGDERAVRAELRARLGECIDELRRTVADLALDEGHR